MTGSGCDNGLANGSGLALAQMTAMCDGNEAGDDSVYARQAQDTERVKRALKAPCCKTNCKKGLPFTLVMKMITLFWALPKVSQDCVLWSMQQAGTYDRNRDSEEESDGSDSEESGKHRPKIHWSIEGLYVLIFVH